MALPSISRTRSSLPGGGGSSAPLPRGTRTVLPPGSLYEPPPLAHFSTVGTLSAVAIPCATAMFSGSGGLAAVAAPVAVADFTAEGTFSVPTNDTNADFAGSGTLTATAIPCALAQFTGSGTVSAAVVASASAAFSGAATLSAPAIPGATAAFTGAGTLGATALTFTPSGMTKNGAVAWTTGTAWVTIQNWTPNTATYPGSSVDGSHRLVVQGSKTGATISGQAAYTDGGFARTHSIRLVDQSGNVIATGAPNTNTAGNCTVTATGVDLSGITAIELQMSGDFSAGTLSAGAGTFVTVT